MATIESSILIDRQVEDVYAYVSDVGNDAVAGPGRGGGEGHGWAGWGRYPNPGCRQEARGTQLDGRRGAEVEPGVRIAYKGEAGPLTTSNTYTFESVAGGTKVTHADEFELRSTLRLVEFPCSAVVLL